jgi:hypothetical protein
MIYCGESGDDMKWQSAWWPESGLLMEKTKEIKSRRAPTGDQEEMGENKRGDVKKLFLE